MSFAPVWWTPPATPDIYALSLHDALPIFPSAGLAGDERQVPVLVVDVEAVAVDEGVVDREAEVVDGHLDLPARGDRKSTRLNSRHVRISYAVFCLKKKKHT